MLLCLSQQAMAKPEQTLTYIPTEEDKKRTLKETAPVKMSDDTIKKPKGSLDPRFQCF